MHDPLDIRAKVFVVYPSNHKLVYGALTFEQNTRQKILSALLWYILTMTAIVVIYLIFIRQNADLKTLYFVCVPVIFLSIHTVNQSYSAWIHYRLDPGQFITGNVTYCELYWERRGKGKAFVLKLIYCFDTPTGTKIERTIIVTRQDLSPKFYKGIRATIRLMLYGEEASPPEVGMLLKIRYVNDDLFRVM